MAAKSSAVGPSVRPRLRPDPPPTQGDPRPDVKEGVKRRTKGIHLPSRLAEIAKGGIGEEGGPGLVLVDLLPVCVVPSVKMISASTPGR